MYYSVECASLSIALLVRLCRRRRLTAQSLTPCSPCRNRIETIHNPTQTYEGGLGGAPGNEAHGGYTYCGVAALALLDALPALNLPALARWLAQRQGTVEGGFNGRTNKLADGCYSFWQGAALPLVAACRGPLAAQALAVGTPRPGDAELDVPELPSMEGVCTPYEEVGVYFMCFCLAEGICGLPGMLSWVRRSCLL